MRRHAGQCWSRNSVARSTQPCRFVVTGGEVDILGGIEVHGRENEGVQAIYPVRGSMLTPLTLDRHFLVPCLFSFRYRRVTEAQNLD